MFDFTVVRRYYVYTVTVCLHAMIVSLTFTARNDLFLFPRSGNKVTSSATQQYKPYFQQLSRKWRTEVS